MFKGTKATTAAHCGHCQNAIVADKTHAGTFYTVTELGDAGKIHTEVLCIPTAPTCFALSTYHRRVLFTSTCLLLDPYSFIVLAYHLILTASLSCFLLLHLSLSVLGSSPASARTKVPALQWPCSSDP
jgi:hypothetical protein